MRKGKRVLYWAVLLWKRLYKKAGFLMILLLIPAVVFGYGQVAREESGMVTIALTCEGQTVEPLTRAVWDDLRESQVLRFVEAVDVAAAKEMVLQGEADVAWIFAENLEEKIYAFAAHSSRANAFVTVVEPENRVELKLVREVLSGVLFPHCSEALYINYVRTHIAQLDEVSDDQLLTYYHSAISSGELFQFTDLEGNVVEKQQEGYLMAPVRGMLATIIVLAGLATAMYYLHDRRQGTFSWIAQDRQWLVELGCQLISVVNVALVAVLALWVSGQVQSLGIELAVAGLYSVCVAGFSMLVRRVCLGIRGLGMAVPVLVVAMLAVCPVFYDLGALRPLQMLLPPTYFVNGTVVPGCLGYMFIYTLLMLSGCRLWDWATRA